MQVTLTNPNNGRRWRLRPYSNGQCLIIEKSPIGKVNKKNGKEIKSEFVSCDKYPMTWKHGIEMILNLMLLDPEDKDELDVSDIEYVPEELMGAFERRLDEIMVEVEK